jgi:ribosome-associated translation inhibitor RaiA
MKIAVTDVSRTFGRQTRAYAEYRIFSSLAAFSNDVREVTVSLTAGPRSHSVVCSVFVRLETHAPVHLSVRGRHAYDAINRAADQLGPALRRSAHMAVRSIRRCVVVCSTSSAWRRPWVWCI